MEECDVLIIGGGPAGSSLAWGLHDSGLRITVVDKKTFPRDKTCAGWITPAVVDCLQIDLDDYKQRNTLQPITGFRVGTIHGRTIEIDYGRTPVSYGIRRCELDHYLLQRSGAGFHPGFHVKSIERTEKGWNINNSIECRLVVGAGGNFCPVARQLGARPGKTETAVRAQEIEFRMNDAQSKSCPVNPAVPELYFCEDLKGYGWVFRKGDYLNVGLGREDESGLRRHVSDFCRFLQDQHRIPPDIPGKFNGHAYLLYDHADRPLYADKLMLIGDSAGLAYTRSGEGIRPAIESGLIAANVILNSGNDYPAEQLGRYQDIIRQRFGKRQKNRFSYIPPFVKQWLAGKLLGMHWFVRDVVISNWFLHRQQGELDLADMPVRVL